MKGKKLIQGTGASAGEVVGIVRVANGEEVDMEKLMELKDGEILVVHKTQPDHEPYMARAAGFVSNTGGVTPHMAIIAREWEKPAVVGTLNATKVLQTGQTVLVDGTGGGVYEWIGPIPEVAPPKPRRAPAVSLADKMKEIMEQKGIAGDFSPEMWEKLKKREEHGD